MKSQKGITLIALIITIIVLLILAGVTILMLTGEHGILNRGTKAVTETYHATVKEQIILGTDEYFTEKLGFGYKSDVITYLKDKNYIEKNESDGYYRVKVENIASTVKTGKGQTKADGDIYVIEQYNPSTSSNIKVASTVQSDIKVAAVETNTKYVLRYYETETESRDLLYFDANGTIRTPSENPVDPQDPVVPENPIVPTDDDIAITYVEDLVNLQTAVNGGDTKSGKRIILVNDLDFNDSASYNDATSISYGDLNRDGTTEDIKTELTKGNGFTPIGTNDNQFEGEFYGNKHTIKNIKITNREAALFVYNKGLISLLTIETDSITPAQYGAAFAVYNYGTIEKCKNKSNINAQWPIAIAGITAVNYGTVKECINYANITGNTKVAGIVGENHSSEDHSSEEITKCTNYGQITASSSYVAGIVAYSDTSVNITDCANRGNITSQESDNSNCGGIIGFGSGKIENCSNGSTISALGSQIGGIAGDGTFEINNCYNKEGLMDVDNGSNVGGILGRANGDTTINKCFNVANITNGSQNIGGILGTNVSVGSVVSITSCYNEGTLENINDGSYVGGIIGYVQYDEVIIDKCYNTGNVNYPSASYVGGIIGYGNNKFSITSAYNSGEVSGNNYTAGIVGYMTSSSSSIDKAYNTAKIQGNINSTSDGYIGGIVGYMSNGTAINIYNTGEISAEKSSYVGGIVGRMSTTKTISNALNIGDVNAIVNVGGIIGYGDSSIIKNVYNAGTVTGVVPVNVGIIFGWINENSSENLYYLSSLSGKPIGTYGGGPDLETVLTEKILGKTEQEMKLPAFLNELNGNKDNIEGAVGFKVDSTTSYPILDFTVNIEN